MVMFHVKQDKVPIVEVVRRQQEKAKRAYADCLERWLWGVENVKEPEIFYRCPHGVSNYPKQEGFKGREV